MAARGGVVGRMALVSGMLLVGGLCFAQGADAFIYWANTGTTIGRARSNGTGADQGFLASGQACGVALDKKHIYWTGHANGVPGQGTIGRARIDGSHRQPNFITGASNPCGLAVDRGHVYWSNTVSAGWIGRARLNGSHVQRKFVPTRGYACGVAVDRSHLFWANRDFGTIGRSSLSGRRASVRQGFIHGGGNDTCGVAVNRAHLYWADLQGNRIGRAGKGGRPASVDQGFITGASHPCGLAVDGAHIFWANSLTGTIGRANLNGTGINQSLVPATIPCWVAATRSR